MGWHFEFQHLHACREPLLVPVEKRHFTLKNPDALEQSVAVAEGPVGCFYH